MANTTTEPADETARCWETAEYWTRHWLDDSAQTLEPWRVEGDGRPRVADRAERAIRRPPLVPTRGSVRDEVVVRRRVARGWLDEADRHLADLVERRRRLVERIDACTLALAGTGRLQRRSRSLVRGERSDGPGASLSGEVSSGETRPGEVSARVLRREAVALVLAADMALDLAEIQRLLGLLGGDHRGTPVPDLEQRAAARGGQRRTRAAPTRVLRARRRRALMTWVRARISR